MRNAEDDEGGVLDDVDEVGNSDEVGREIDVREIAGVLVLLVHDLGEEALAGNLKVKRRKEGRRGRAGRDVSGRSFSTRAEGRAEGARGRAPPLSLAGRAREHKREVQSVLVSLERQRERPREMCFFGGEEGGEKQAPKGEI